MSEPYPFNPGELRLEPISPEQQKHEEVKRMAEKFFRECIIEIECDNRSTKEALMASWEYAKEFYEFAKEKQEGEENGDA